MKLLLFLKLQVNIKKKIIIISGDNLNTVHSLLTDLDGTEPRSDTGMVGRL